MMEFEDVIRKRTSTRKFKDKMVEDELIEKGCVPLVTKR